jgi:Zn-dependent protease with chaperone function
MLVGLWYLPAGLRRTVPLMDSGSVNRGGLGLATFLTLGVTVVVLGFYILVLDDRKRNYGGWTCSPRWLLWLTPLWLVAMLPVADWSAGRRWARLLAYLFLAVSVFSVSYPWWNPWRHPWIYNWLEAQGVVKY